MEPTRTFLHRALHNPLEQVVPRDNTTLACNLADVNVSLHDVVERSVVEPAGFFTNETWLDKHFHATETFGAINDDVSVWEVVLDLHRGWSHRRQLLRHVLKNPLEHGRST